MTWILLSVFSALSLGLYDVAKKAALDENVVLKVLFFSSLSGALLIWPLAFLLGCVAPVANTSFPALLELSPTGHLLVLAKAGIVTCSWVLTFYAIKALPISLAAPIRSTAPFFTAMLAMLLFAERPRPLQVLGLVVLLGSYFAFSLVGRKENVHFGQNRWVWMLLAGTLLGAVSGLYDKHLLQHARLGPFAVQFWFTQYNAVVQAVVFLLAQRFVPRKAGAFRWRWAIPLVALLLLIADGFYFRALAIPGALISIVSAIRRSNVVVSFTLGGALFRERYRRQKAWALAGVLVGLWLLLA